MVETEIENEDVDVKIQVECRMLDDYSEEVEGNILVKIDTEGNELKVLEGGQHFIRRHRPMIVFESWKDARYRKQLFERFEVFGYEIFNIPVLQSEFPLPLTRQDFCADFEENYLAMCKSRQLKIQVL